jgi:mannosyltransferase OCH1-like enzyme
MKELIPRIVHYCWFGGTPLPEKAQKCIESWKRNLPGYEIRETNEENFDVHSNPFVSQAYANKKFAFVSDYARFWRLYTDGGIYMDTDVEILKPLDVFLGNDAFTGFENRIFVNPGIMFGAKKEHPVVKEMLDFYGELEFVLKNGSLNMVPVVIYTTEILIKHGLKRNNRLQELEGITVYPKTYFCPLSFYGNKTYFSEQTHSIHHYASTWMTEEQRKGFKDPKYTFYGPNVKSFLTIYGNWFFRKIAPKKRMGVK